MNYNFFIYGLCGWNIEVLWTGICGLFNGDLNMVGHSSVWMFVIYGGGGVILETVYKRIKKVKWYERGLIWTYLIFTIEFISGALFKVVGIEAWRYNGLFSVAGFIRLDYAPLWFVVGLLFERICIIINKAKTVLINRKPSPQ